MTLPTFKTVWSRYLFDRDTPPTGDDLLNESIIRDNKMDLNKDGVAFKTHEISKEALKIKTAEFMADGALGSLINGANVGVPSL